MPNYMQRSRRSNRGNRTNKILNILIGVVVVLIIITVAFIFVDGGDPPKDKASDPETVNTDVSNDSGGTEGEKEDQADSSPDTSTDQNNDSGTVDDEQSDGSSTESGNGNDTATLPDDSQAEEQASDDPVVEKTITNPSWQPVGTSQTGEHVSSYDQNSKDWAEKVQAISYATGLSQDSMIIWRIGNGGSPQKSIGTVSSSDKKQKYRVFLQWVDGQGWKPEKMDVLNSIEGAY